MAQIMLTFSNYFYTIFRGKLIFISFILFDIFLNVIYCKKHQIMISQIPIKLIQNDISLILLINILHYPRVSEVFSHIEALFLVQL